MDQAAFPVVSEPGSVSSFQGSVFGGHAPVVDAHVFLVEATWTGYSVGVKSLLSANVNQTGTYGTVSTYPVTEDLTAGSPTKGFYYVTTDLNGLFNITGDYSCDKGFPVYAYATGGAPSATTTINITGVSYTVTGSTYTYTFTASNLLYAGQNVQFSSSSLGGQYASLNLTTQTVLATPTSTSFQISTSIAPATGGDTQTGYATSVGPINPVISNMAMLGICPGNGNFTTPVHFIYMNEVSTVAMAYAMAGFSTDSLHMGSSAANETGLQNAAYNAANLYNIQLFAQTANTTTVNGSGTVPQAELHTLANILANCVDSANTATTASPSCTSLFAAAPNSSGAQPTDTATAAINIAHNPGAHITDLFKLASGAVPFTPQLSAAPKDFTVAITYTGIASPGGVAIDANGSAFIPTNSTSGYVTKIPATGALSASATAGSGFDSIAIDSGGNVFVAAQTSHAMYAYTNTLGAVTGSPFASTSGIGPTSVVVDSSANGNYVYLTGSNNSNQIIQRFPNTATATPTIGTPTTLTNNCLPHVNYLALDANDDLWASVGSANSVCRITNAGGSVFNDGGYSGPTNVAIDSGGNGWFGAGQQTNLFRVSPTGTSSPFGVINNVAQGGLASPSWVAIDGTNNVWVTNNGNSYALSEFASSGVAITSSTGYQSGNLSAPSFLAIDGSGNVWIPNSGSNSVTEIIGVASPTVTPLSVLKPGTLP